MLPTVSTNVRELAESKDLRSWQAAGADSTFGQSLNLISPRNTIL